MFTTPSIAHRILIRKSPYRQRGYENVNEVPRVLFLGICLDFYYFLRRVLLPKFGALRNLDVRVGTMDLAVATLTPGSFS